MGRKSGNQSPPDPQTKSKARQPDPVAAPPAQASVEQDKAPLATPFRVVAIGASAGGLEALSELFAALPSDTGLAYILVLHQSTQGPHLLPQILGRCTHMPVAEAVDGMRIEPSHLYINPPDSGLILEGDTLKTYLRPTEKELPKYIDVLFESVAKEKQALAVGVLLSGLDSDGVNGIRMIQQAGGVTFAQNRTARFNELPANAIAAVSIDFVLPAKEIASELALLASMPIIVKGTEAMEQPDFDAAYLGKVLEEVSRVTKIDFTSYKIKTLQRRLWRRMLMSRITDLNAYLEHLRQNPQEANGLATDFLINVTSFFREPTVFQALQENIFPELVKQAEHRPLRIWVPACATGEEAYSIGMAYLEFLEDMATNPKLQIFATDLSETAINLARRGIYPEADLEGVSAERRKHFFTKVDGGFQISQAVRNMCIFAVQNVLSDPPISHVDLISCNNLFIYLKDGAQRQAIKSFHYALNPNGYLLMGSAESIASAADLFSLEDSKKRIYRKKPSAGELAGFLPRWEQKKPEVSQQLRGIEPISPIDRVKQEADHLILSQYAPAGFLVNEDLDIIQFRGDTGPFLQPSTEVPSLHLNQMVRPELQPAVHEAVEQARRSGMPFRKDGIRLMLNGNLMHYEMSATPLHSGSAAGGSYYLVLLFPAVSTPSIQTDAVIAPDGEDEAATIQQLKANIRQLKQELAGAQRYMQDLKEEHYAATEELRAAMEEAQSNNEELQSTVEELESTKEELQSNNEELNTINEELYAKNNELIRANDDLNNLLTSSNQSFIILDGQGHIRRFSEKAREVFSLIDSDLGRPLSDIKPKVEMPPIEPLIKEAVKRLDPQSVLIRDQQGKEYQLNVRPYKTAENRIEGVVLIVQGKS